MAGWNVIYTETIFPYLDVEQAILNEVGANIRVGNYRTPDDLIAGASSADAVATFAFKSFTPQVLDALVKCRVIVRGGIGVDTIDVPAATERGILVVNVPSYCVNEVSDHAISLMCSLLRRLPVAMASIRKGDWNREVVKPLHSLRSLTVGIIGFGNIGRLSGVKASAFGMSIVFYDPCVPGDVKIGNTTARKVDLVRLLKDSDAVLLHAPATKATYHLINRDTLNLVKPGCVIVNTARPQLIDTGALVEYLENGRLGGVGLDMIENVPPFSDAHPLLRFENVVITPYVAWYTEESVIALRETMAQEIVRVFKGISPLSVVNKDVKAHARAGRLKAEL